MPVLKYKDLELSQSVAIARFLAKKFDLVGANEQEAAKCDEIVDALKDFTNGKSQSVGLFPKIFEFEFAHLFLNC